MNVLPSTSFCNYQITRFNFAASTLRNNIPVHFPTKSHKIHATSNELEAQALEEPKEEAKAEPNEPSKTSTFSTASSPLDKDLKKVCFRWYSTGLTLISDVSVYFLSSQFCIQFYLGIPADFCEFFLSCLILTIIVKLILFYFFPPKKLNCIS